MGAAPNPQTAVLTGRGADAIVGTLSPGRGLPERTGWPAPAALRPHPAPPMPGLTQPVSGGIGQRTSASQSPAILSPLVCFSMHYVSPVSSAVGTGGADASETPAGWVSHGEGALGLGRGAGGPQPGRCLRGAVPTPAIRNQKQGKRTSLRL